jgi:RNA methyltransferase, TrmH family
MLTPREAKELRALKTRKNREESGRFLAEGVRLVEDLVASTLSIPWVVTASSLEDSERGRALIEALDRRAIPRRHVPDRDFQALAATEVPQGVIAVAVTPDAALPTTSPADPPSAVLLLDAVQDPGNFGTLVRSAEALGALAVVALPGTVDPWNPKAVRSAAGASFRVPILQQSWAEARDELRGLGYVLLGAAAEGDPLPEPAPRRSALIVGNEGAGLSPEVKRGVDRLVGIPLRGRAESLNVAAAAAILLFQLTR